MFEIDEINLGFGQWIIEGIFVKFDNFFFLFEENNYFYICLVQVIGYFIEGYCLFGNVQVNFDVRIIWCFESCKGDIGVYCEEFECKVKVGDYGQDKFFYGIVFEFYNL